MNYAAYVSAKLGVRPWSATTQTLPLFSVESFLTSWHYLLSPCASLESQPCLGMAFFICSQGSSSQKGKASNEDDWLPFFHITLLKIPPRFGFSCNFSSVVPSPLWSLRNACRFESMGKVWLMVQNPGPWGTLKSWPCTPLFTYKFLFYLCGSFSQLWSTHTHTLFPPPPPKSPES